MAAAARLAGHFLIALGELAGFAIPLALFAIFGFGTQDA